MTMGIVFYLFQLIGMKIQSRKIRKLLKSYSIIFTTLIFGFNKIKGSYVENREDDTTVTVEEDSLIVYGKSKDEITLLRLGKQLGRRYKQEAILFINSEGKAKYYNLLTDSAVELGRFIYTIVGDYFSTIGKKQFSFSILESVEPERQYMRAFYKKHLGLL